MRFPDARMMFGFGLLITIASLAVVIALGHVEQETSHGLNIVLGSLATVWNVWTMGI